MKHEWKQIKWPFNDKAPYSEWECYRYGNIILYPSGYRLGEFNYVANFGANSDRSHSGGFPDGFTLDQAKQEVEKRYKENKW